MKLLSVRSARSIWLVPLAYVNPRGKFLVPAAEAIVQRYRFSKGPDLNALTASPMKLQFDAGAFVALDGSNIVVNLTVHEDGIVVETRNSTSESDRFVEDLMTWMSEEYGLPTHTELNPRRIYASELAVRFEKPPAVFTDRFEKFRAKLTAGSHQSTAARPMDLIQLNFGTDPTSGPQSTLRIEREVNTPFSESRYYSYAQTQTEEHIRLLREFESAAS
jgi:hypothetical protein